MILDKGIYEWDVIIEKHCDGSLVGVCAPENLNYETFAGYQATGWVLCTGGYRCNLGNFIGNYRPSIGDGAIITVHIYE